MVVEYAIGRMRKWRHLRGNRKATTHLSVYRYGNISRLSGMNPQFMVSDHLSGIPTIRPVERNGLVLSREGASRFCN
jgi:hypothetical protein